MINKLLSYFINRPIKYNLVWKNVDSGFFNKNIIRCYINHRGHRICYQIMINEVGYHYLYKFVNEMMVGKNYDFKSIEQAKRFVELDYISTVLQKPISHHLLSKTGKFNVN